jgi:hypothetical protein
MNEREARESGLSAKASVAPKCGRSEAARRAQVEAAVGDGNEMNVLGPRQLDRRVVLGELPKLLHAQHAGRQGPKQLLLRFAQIQPCLHALG